VAMLSDFIPEAVALGASFASGNPTAKLLAALIAIQNLPEGFNAYREITVQGKTPGRRVIATFFAMSLLGPCAGLCGYYLLASHDLVVACMMLFASGGILYLVFQDIAPVARLQRRWMPAMGAVFGFMLGLVGKMLVWPSRWKLMHRSWSPSPIWTQRRWRKPCSSGLLEPTSSSRTQNAVTHCEIKITGAWMSIRSRWSDYFCSRFLSDISKVSCQIGANESQVSTDRRSNQNLRSKVANVVVNSKAVCHYLSVP